jgi:hypothetical protein
MIDTHPGQRVYGFDAQGNRFRLWQDSRVID